MRRSEVAVLVLDAGEGVTTQDFRLAEYIVSAAPCPAPLYCPFVLPRALPACAAHACCMSHVARRQLTAALMLVSKHLPSLTQPLTARLSFQLFAGRGGSCLRDCGEQVGHRAAQDR